MAMIPKDHPIYPVLSLMFRMFLGFVFLIAAVPKVADPAAFGKSIMNYDLLPMSMVNIAAIALAWMELVAGLALVAGVKVRSAALLTSAMLVIFIGGISWALANNLSIDCGCFSQGGGGQQVGLQKIAEDIGLLMMSATLVFFGKDTKLVFNNRDVN